MPELQDNQLGTPPEHKVSHAIHRIGSRLVGDFFLASYLVDCLNMVSGLGPVHKLLLVAEGEKRAVPADQIQAILAKEEDKLRWVAQVKAEDYHRTNVLSFLSLWAAQEAGNENVVAAILGTYEKAAAAAGAKFKAGKKYPMDEWPWTEDRCLEVAQKLDQKSKEETTDGGWDFAARLVTVYGWLGATLQVDGSAASKYNEANMVRNVLLHRYGRLGPRDIERAPHLVGQPNNAIQLSRKLLAEYYNAIVAVHTAISAGVAAAGWK